MKNIKDYDLQDLKEELVSIGEKGFRAEQIFKWLYQDKVKRFDDMTNLSLELREKLKQNYTICNYNILKKQEASDGTKKYLFDILDGNAIESVLMEYHYGKSICVSSQVGCKMGCKFCASTIAGFKRNLAASEMLLQIYEAERDSGRHISGVVLMGIGEPLDNYNNVINFLTLLSCADGANISLRHVSLSTCGLVPKIYELAKLKLGLTLSISLHAADNEARSEIMPVNDSYDINELLKACHNYFDTTGRRISFEYALIDGHNDSYNDAKKLYDLLKNFICHVNIIPVNKIKERDFKSDRKSAYRFQKYLEELGINATVRRTLGADIDAACGQLRREYEI